MEKQKNITILLVSVILVGILSFYAGVMTEKKSNSHQLGFERQSRGSISMNPNRNRQGGMINGDIKTKEDNTLTIGTTNGGSRIVLFSDKTKVTKSTEGSLTDLGVGTGVMVIGTENQDGSVTAQNIQIRNDQVNNVQSPKQNPE
ncbi:MAG: hypothetical protein PHW52_00420 [Candidatus Pacebacteria bacterium]|nr:hypothetical protein [Candidatus Paceibacterota bacterium]